MFAIQFTFWLNKQMIPMEMVNMTYNIGYMIHIYFRENNNKLFQRCSHKFWKIYLDCFCSWDYIFLWYDTIECWILLTYVLDSVNMWQIHVTLTQILEIFIVNNFQLKCCWKQYEVTYNVRYSSCTDKHLSAAVEIN